MRLLLKLGAHISFVGFLASVAIFASLNLQAYTDGLVSTTSTATSNFSKQTLSVYADNLGSIASTVNAQEKEDQKTVLAANTPQASVIDAGAPLSLPTPVVVPRPAVQQEAVVTTPYSLNDEAAAQLSSLGYSLTDLRTQGVTVIGHSGAVPRRCATGTSGGLYAQGMALRASARYTPCPDGGSPLYDAYRPAGYTCVVVYNSQSS
mgnify:CR=1 FL=1